VKSTMKMMVPRGARHCSGDQIIVHFTLTRFSLCRRCSPGCMPALKRRSRRAIGMWLVFLPAPFLIAKWVKMLVRRFPGGSFWAHTYFAALFLLPALFGWGVKIRHDAWNRAGFAAALICIVCAPTRITSRCRAFRGSLNVPVASRSIARYRFRVPMALDGLVRTERGVYELRMDLADKPQAMGNCSRSNTTIFPTPRQIRTSRSPSASPKCRRFCGFSRFPVTRFHKEGDVAVVEIADIRFVQIRRDRPAAFTYRVRFGSEETCSRKAGPPDRASILAGH